MIVTSTSLEGLDRASLEKLDGILRRCCASTETEKVTYEESCYFFEYYQDMNASIPACNYNGRLGPRDCNKNCPWYVNRADVDNIIRESLNNKEDNK